MKSKDLDCVSFAMPIRGVSTKISPVARLLILDRLAFRPHLPSPMFGQIFPSGISLFNQSNLLFLAPALELLFATFCHIYIIVLLKINQSSAFVLLRESLDLAGFVSKNTRIDKAS